VHQTRDGSHLWVTRRVVSVPVEDKHVRTRVFVGCSCLDGVHHLTPPLLEMSQVWCGDGVVNTQPHGRMHWQARERGGGAPRCLLRFNPVRARLLSVFRCGGDGVEAQSQLLVNRAVGVE
jgi:hypothetical protein